MNVKIDQEACIACGICYDTCSDVYESDEDGNSRLVEDYRTDDERTGEVPEELADCAEEGMEQCPVDAIEVS
ncbi:ferredoxin [Candidatus Bipolaricaulota bacterium]|nr:ferredoxin [Candidatus Bipolaricaulota bacterium]MBS3825373.1 ferredoxin [Candidatus Bipolaricaulota bacterium]